jgi:hypothetical protein
MKHEQQLVIKRWMPILQEYERTRTKVTPRAFKSVKKLCEAHHLSPKELRRYYTKWMEAKKDPSARDENRGQRPINGQRMKSSNPRWGIKGGQRPISYK